MMVIMKMASQTEGGLKIIFFLHRKENDLIKKGLLAAADVCVIVIQPVSYS